MLRKFTTLLVVLLPVVMAGQNKSIVKGKIQTELGNNIDSYTMVLLSLRDSTVVGWDTFFSDIFEFKELQPQTYILRIQDVQFESFDTIIELNEGVTVLPEPIILKERRLNEVIVNAKYPTIYSKNGNLIVDVRNSYLKDANSISNLFNKLPSIEVDAAGTISMFGKDNILIYVNDKEVLSQDQLKSLQPSDIDKIEIIKNVGAEYSASADAIIKVQTKNDREEDVGIMINNGTSYGRKWSADTNIRMYYNTGKILQYLTYSNGTNNGRQFDKNDTYTYLEDYTSINQREMTINNKFRHHNIFYSFDYDLNNKNRLGLQYSGVINKWISNHSGLQIIKNDEIEKAQRKIYDEEVRKKDLHNMSVNYKHQFGDNNSFTLVSDYAFSLTGTGNDITESDVNTDYLKHQYNISKSDYRIFSMQPDLKFFIRNNMLALGAKYSTMNSDSKINYSSTDTQVNNRLGEHIGALYVIWAGKINTYDYSIGLRGEYAHTGIEEANPVNKVNRDYWNLFPYIMIGKKITETMNASLYYRRRIQRPSFSALNPTFIYRDSLSYVTGNPYLKPANVDEVALSVDLSNVSFSAGYYMYNNMIILDNVQDINNPSISIDTYGNLKKKNGSLNTSISYTYNYSIFTGVASFDVDKPFITLPYLDSFKKLNKAICLFKLSTNFKLHENTSIDATFALSSKGDSQNMEMESYSDLNFEINQYVFKKHLLISLAVYDVFHNKKTNCWSSYSDKIRYVMNTNPDSRCIALTLRYDWGVSKKNIQKMSSNTDSINRM